MTTSWTIDTNAGPWVRFEGTWQACRAHVERQYLARRYTVEWTKTGAWHIATVRNTRGNVFHRLAFTPTSRLPAVMRR